MCKLSFCEAPSFSAIRSLLMFLAFRCAHRDTSSFRRLHDAFLPALRLLRSQVALSKVSSSEHCTREREELNTNILVRIPLRDSLVPVVKDQSC